ncbi:arp2/3 complex-activating protein rickA-like isoform X2 [Haliotis rufescens]|uniref:arp2/3 complex-activating protein rickA-like isoform X2 n=1 Tax=Haliotis rufescens TaxID=6454 RepID=UPI00201F9E78|nr:arp2/3 complex-activating protein rickA-like isoform X2 [Haliotis rufescens]
MAESKRRPNWTEEERILLIDNVNKIQHRLFGKFKGCGTQKGGKIKEQAWEEVVNTLNACPACESLVRWKLPPIKFLVTTIACTTAVRHIRRRMEPQAVFQIFVPDDNKDDRYWCRRKKNKETRRSLSLTTTKMTDTGVGGRRTRRQGEYDKDQKTGKKVSAFFGPDLWDETYDNTDISLEYMDLEEFLKENGIPNNPDNTNAANLNKFQSPNRQMISSGHNLQACDMPQDTLARNSQQAINSAPDTLPSNSQQAISSAPDTFPSNSQQAISSAPDTFPNDSPQTTPSPQNMFPNDIPQVTPSPQNTFPNDVPQTTPSPQNMFPNDSRQTTPSPQNMFPNDSRQTTPSPQNMFPNDIPQTTPWPQNMFPNDIPQTTPSPQNMFPNDIPQATPLPPNTFPNDIPQTTPSPPNMFPNDIPQTTPSPPHMFPNYIPQTTPSPPNIFPNDIPQTTPSPPNMFPNDIPQTTPSPQNMFLNDIPQTTPSPPNMFPNDIPQTTPSPQNMFLNDIPQTTPSPQNMFPNDSTQATSLSPTTCPRQLPSHQSQLAVSQYDTMPSPPTSVTSSAAYSPVGSPAASPKSVDCSVSSDDLTLVNIEGLKDFDPRKRTFSEELKPQPMFKKSRKIFVPDDNKDDRYWCRRKKNNVAAKRSRDARRIKENQIAMRAAFLEKENSVLRTELEQIKRENADILISLTEFETMEP